MDVVKALNRSALKTGLHPRVSLSNPNTGELKTYDLSTSNLVSISQRLTADLENDLLSTSRTLVASLIDSKGRSLAQNVQCNRVEPIELNPIVADHRTWLVLHNPAQHPYDIEAFIMTGDKIEGHSSTPSAAMSGVYPVFDKSQFGPKESLGVGLTPQRKNADFVPQRVVPFALDRFSAKGRIELDPTRYGLVQDGDAKIEGKISASTLTVTDGPVGSSEGIRIDYQFHPGWKFLVLQAQGEVAARKSLHPISLNMFVKGNRSLDKLVMRFIDSTNQVFQPAYGQIDWTGWKFVSFPLTGRDCWHWGGANDGVAHFPIRLNALALVDSAGGVGKANTIELTGITLVERQQP
jgi:hypothetical protein